MNLQSATAPPSSLGTGKPGRRPTHMTWVWAITALTAVVYASFSVVRDYTYRTATYDLVIFDQAIRSYAHFKPGISIVKGMHNFGNPHFSVLGDHFSPIDALLAPLYWVYDSPVDLLVAQAILFALAIPPIWIFAHRAFGGGRRGAIAGYCAVAAYALSWTIAAALGFDFHEVAFAPVLTAVALERLQRGRLKTALLALFGLLLVKEDMGLFVAGLGLGLVVTRRLDIPRQRLTGLLIAFFGLAASAVALYVIVPHMGGRSNYYWGYDDLGPNAPAAVAHLFAHPLSSAKILITPAVKWHTELELFAPFLFLSLLSPITIAVLPLLLERMLSMKFTGWWGDGAQYNTYLIVPLVLGAVDGALRLDRWFGSALRGRARSGTVQGKIALGAVALFALVAVVLVPSYQFGQAFRSSFYQRDATAQAEAAVAARVPSGVTVEVTSAIGPHLDARDTVELWDGDGDSPEFPPWVIVNGRQGQFTWLTGLSAQQRRIALLKARGYVTVFSDDGYVLMHAPRA